MNKELIVRWTILILILVIGLLVVRTCMRKLHQSGTVMPGIGKKIELVNLQAGDRFRA
ncbi:MAG TPA: hypothetical protein VKA08_10635 [Balneolales bacterium]|nr:hypothetical protein [Balneolales bacterium]